MLKIDDKDLLQLLVESTVCIVGAQPAHSLDLHKCIIKVVATLH